jgi:hypothetical protein
MWFHILWHSNKDYLLAYIPQNYYNHDRDRLQALTPRLSLKQRREFTSHTSEGKIYDLTVL